MDKAEKKPGEPFFITMPIYYVNARPHIGHAYTTIVCDSIARRQRMLGKDVLFLTGTDEHGQKIERSASAAGTTPQKFADQVASEFRALWDRMGITYDDYIRTTEPRHTQAVQKLFQEMVACVQQHELPLETALPHFTSNTADVLKLSRKGRLREGFDADLLVLRKDTLELVHVLANGNHLMIDGQVREADIAGSTSK